MDENGELTDGCLTISSIKLDQYGSMAPVWPI